jgi:hypothetical protein
MIRPTHWVGVVCVTLLLLSGLQILNAHPALYLGQASDFAQPIASIGAAQQDARPTQHHPRAKGTLMWLYFARGRMV